jgi:Flp pilus assembly protein TadG
MTQSAFCDHSRKGSRTRAPRRGVAAVELAVCLPVMVLFTFGSIEVCSAIYLRQSLAISTYEGARVACHRQGSGTAATAAAQRILTERRIVGGNIALTPSNIDDVAAGSLIKVSVSAPASSNSLLRFGLFGDARLSSDCSMRKE